MTKRKTFISYYHKDDQKFKEKFKRKFEDLIVSKSVEVGDIDADNSEEYIKQLIQKNYLRDTTVLVVLLGAKTRCRKHVDWEISGALNPKIGDGPAGLLGILLPTHPDFNSGKPNPNNVPKRLQANIDSGYAVIEKWTGDITQMRKYINDAYDRRHEKADKRRNNIPQMPKNTCN